MAAQPRRRTHNLSHTRLSLPGARCFLTVCVKNRDTGLTRNSLAEQLLAATETVFASPDAELLAGVLMPDHVHLLFKVGDRLSFNQLLGKWKTKTGLALRTHGLAWQRSAFEHRLRPEEAVERYGLYIFLNPHRARLLAPTETWPYCRIWAPGILRFVGLLEEGRGPPAEWLGEVEAWRSTSPAFPRR